MRAQASPATGYATGRCAAAAYMICCCKSSGYGACVVVFNDYVRYIERLNFFACQHTESIVAAARTSIAGDGRCGGAAI